ncbi:Hypothetical protein MUW33_1648 [Mycobacterium canetti]|uniref:hypothetical protein n=1 Tax=Mycobacterium canetti TaxID=78331 RepID=UPI002D7967D1|nr:hypothetical protein [Mycobacterium canetti]WRO41616.1 Hypothetical protein MUW33_1648 [Mycobacterium canetti]
MARSANDYQRELERWVRQQQRAQDQFRMGVQRAIEREIQRQREVWRRRAEQARKVAEEELRKRGRERRPLDKLPPGLIPGTGGQPVKPFKPSR